MSLNFTKLQNAVQDAAVVVQDQFGRAGLDRMLIQITVSTDKYDGLEIKYTVAKGKYESNGVVGNDLGPALVEFLRRNGWDISHNTKLITSVS
ncbi:MAG TPA: hypothetical protein VF733_00165 [Candidatus Saccharimonadales bacterium]